jgi:subtilase family serine protease
MPQWTLEVTTVRGRLFSFGSLVAGVVTLTSVVGATPAHSQSVAAPQVVSACGTPAPGHAACLAERFTSSFSAASIGALGTIPYSPQTIKTAYGFPTSFGAGAGQTIALVDAYDDPHVQADLNTFDTKFGLPTCNKANGCFLKVNEKGGTSTFPPTDKGWDLEISLDVEWAHAIAPAAKILLVEASTEIPDDLTQAVQTASARANYVSNSWGYPEFLAQETYDARFVRPGVSEFSAAGDSGLPALWPSASPNVISVGGTSLLTFSNGTTAFEAGWRLGGGGCSEFEQATAAQKTRIGYQVHTGCNGRRATPDLSSVADLNTGVAVYDSDYGWQQVGGTSVSSPIIAARAAVVGGVVDANRIYGAGGLWFRDIQNGNNGAPCLGGYDLCTGMGSLIH